MEGTTEITVIGVEVAEGVLVGIEAGAVVGAGPAGV